ncbi:MAG: hypothetical protein J7K23_00910 [Thermoproteales archaeon]|nr:hypothetical protein [Thermoproteales archaeon]
MNGPFYFNIDCSGSHRSKRVFDVLRPRISLYSAIYSRLKYVVFEAEAFRLNAAVIDVETTGLDPEEDKMVTFGIYHENRIRIYQLLFGDDLRNYDIIKEELRNLNGKKVYAWYKDFEEKWLNIHGIYELQVRDYEKKDDSVWIEGLQPRYTGRDVPFLWNSWKKYGDICCILAIVERNYLDLLSEAAALFRFPLFSPRVR